MNSNFPPSETWCRMGSFLPKIVVHLLLAICSATYILGASVSVDDVDAAFTYVPSTSWKDVEGLDAFDFGGSHKLTEDPTAYAEITYSFTSFSFVSALYPYQVAVNVFIDDASEPIYIDLQDYDSPTTNSGPGTVPHSIVYASPAGEYAQHTLRVTIPDGEPYAVLDQIIFDVPDDLVSLVSTGLPTQSTSTISSDALSSSSSLQITSSSLTSTTYNPTASSTNTSGSDGAVQAERKARHLAVALGVVGTFLGLFLLALLWWWCRRRSKFEEEERAALYNSPPVISPSPKNGSILDGRATTTILDGRATGTASALDGLATPQVRLLAAQPIIPKGIQSPQNYHSSNLSDGASTPRTTTIIPTGPTPIIPRPAKIDSGYPVNRADSSSYYDTANSVVGVAPRYTSITGITHAGPYSHGDGLAEDDYAGSTEKLGF